MLLYEGRWTERRKSVPSLSWKYKTKCLPTIAIAAKSDQGSHAAPYSHKPAARWSTHRHTHVRIHRKVLIGYLCRSATMAWAQYLHSRPSMGQNHGYSAESFSSGRDIVAMQSGFLALAARQGTAPSSAVLELGCVEPSLAPR